MALVGRDESIKAQMKNLEEEGFDFKWINRSLEQIGRSSDL